MVERQKSKFDRIHFSSKTYKHNTPQDLFVELNAEFHFNFDPARPAIIGKYDENALVKQWAIPGQPDVPLRVYLNPPYDRKLMERFIKKSWQEICENRIELVVFLLPLRATALRFLVKLDTNVEFRLLEKRLKFGNAINGAPFDSVIAVL